MSSAQRVDPEAIAEACGVAPAEVSQLQPAHGGDISRAWTAVVEGQRCFVKTVDLPGLLAAEAASLRWLDTAGAGLRIPRVLGVSETVLVLEFVEAGRPARDHDETLGRGLAQLHRAGAEGFGAPWAGFVGSLAQPNGPTDTWADFLAERRWRPTAALAQQRGALPDGTLPALDRLIVRIDGLLGPPEPPARLHGDLWGGNAMADAAGQPVLVDPAAYGGHREVDLAMMRLFGGFGAPVFDAYAEVHPLATGHQDRVELYQLHPLLAHAAMFGSGYGRRARAVIDQYT